jgi:hypothetical protein
MFYNYTHAKVSKFNKIQELSLLLSTLLSKSGFFLAANVWQQRIQLLTQLNVSAVICEFGAVGPSLLYHRHCEH